MSIPVSSFPRPIRLALSGLVLLLTAAAATEAAELTTAELRRACETSPGHVVRLPDSTKILDGARPPFTEAVGSGCTLVLAGNFETLKVSLTFAGPLTIESTTKAEVKLTESYLSATAVTVRLPAASSAFQTTLSGIRALTGDLSLELGPEATLLVLERLLPGPEQGLAAGAAVRLRGGRKLTALLTEMVVTAPQGFDLQVQGDEGLVKIEEVAIDTFQGGVQIRGTGAKTLVGLDRVDFRFASRLEVHLTGNESALGLKQVTAGGADGVLAPGGILFDIAAGGSANGKIEASEVSFFDVGSITFRSSFTGQQGSLKVEKSQVSASGDIRFESGRLGKTEVKENFGGTEAARLRVAAGPGGGCVSEQNQFFAAILETCP